ncbi:hypothetical protein C8R42DRAFT_724640 [Lentinula raphanica]|nr:hypothetical protein C8R42DRAFT_724640 [Lentinula raphanica]
MSSLSIYIILQLATLECSQASGEAQNDLSASLMSAYEQFDALLVDYEKFRRVWKQEADVEILEKVRSTEEIERGVSATLKSIEQMLIDFTAGINLDYEDHVRSRRAQATSAIIRAGIQMEILRLTEMKMLLPEYLWHAESDILQQLEEILSRSEKECSIEDYITLQKASLRILERVFRSFVSDSTT